MNQSVFGGCSSGTIWYSTPNGFQNAATSARRSGPEIPVGAELLLVRGQAGHAVTAGVHRGLDEHDAVPQPRGAQVALQRDVCARHERTLVLAEGEERGEDDDLAPERGQGHGASLLVDQGGVLRRGPVQHQALARRWRGGSRRSAGGQEGAEREDEDDDEGPAGGQTGQASSSPGGKNVNGRSAREISVEAIQRVRSSKTGAMVDGSSSCCSLKRTEPS